MNQEIMINQLPVLFTMRASGSVLFITGVGVVVDIVDRVYLNHFMYIFKLHIHCIQQGCGIISPNFLPARDSDYGKSHCNLTGPISRRGQNSTKSRSDQWLADTE